MTKQCKKLLKILNELSDSKEQTLYLNLCHQAIKTQDCASKNISDLSDEIVGILQMLTDDGYIVYNSPQDFPDGNFRLTHKGLHWKQILREKTLSYIIKSIIVPIVVSILTTIITIYLTALFQ